MIRSDEKYQNWRKKFKKDRNMDEKKLIDSRKYFVFKIRDLVNNSFHTLEEKRMESLLQYMRNFEPRLTKPS